MVDWIGKYEQMDKDWEKFCYMTKIEHNPLKKTKHFVGKNHIMNITMKGHTR